MAKVLQHPVRWALLAILVLLFSGSAFGGSVPEASGANAAATGDTAAGTGAVPGGAGASSGQTNMAPPAARSLSLEEAVYQGLKTGLDMKAALLELDRDRLSWEQARDAAGRIDSDLIMDMDTAKAKYVTQRRAELLEAAAGRKLKQAELNARQKVEEAYYDVLKADDGLRVAEANLDRAQRQLAMVRAQYAAGTKSRLDVLMAEKEASQADAGVRQAGRGREAAVMKLNQVIGLPLDTPLDLTTRFTDAQAGAASGAAGPAGTFQGSAMPDLEAAIERALRHRPDLQALRDGVELARLTFDQAKKYYTPNVYAYRQAELDLRGAELALEQAVANAEFQVRTAHAAMQGAAEQLAITRKAVEQAREGFRVANLLYVNGMNTSKDLADARLGLLQAETQAVQALFDYNVARSQFGVYSAEGVN